MTQLLISVKNLDEALLALAAKVDVIDLKDPATGALGALDLDVTKQIILKVDEQALVSATVGEGHETVDALVSDIKARHIVGVRVIKVAFSHLFKASKFFAEMLKLTKQGVKLVAVFFADEVIDLKVLSNLKKMGFYGAMIDTQDKRHALMTQKTTDFLYKFTMICKENKLRSGLAGSLRLEQFEGLLEMAPSFIGFRGGVCHDFVRQSTLSPQKVREVCDLLLLYNEHDARSNGSTFSSLHT